MTRAQFCGVIFLLNVHVLASVSAAQSGKPLDVLGNQEGYLGVVVPAAEVEISSDFSGRLRELRVNLGDAVQEGEVLFVLDGGEIERQLRVARAQVRTAAAAVERAREELRQARDRARRRRGAQDLLSREDVADAQYEAGRARAAERSAQGALAAQQAEVRRLEEQLASLEVRAPFAGRVAVRHRGEGAVLASGEPILRFVSESRLLRFAVPEADHQRFTVGDQLDVLFPFDPALSLRARVSRIAPEIDAAGLVLIEGSFESSHDAAASSQLGQACRVRRSP